MRMYKERPEKELVRPWLQPGTRVIICGPGAVINGGPTDQFVEAEIADHGGPICGKSYATITFPEVE